MNGQSITPNTHLNVNYQALDNFLSTENNAQALHESLEKVELELLTSPADQAGDELVVNEKLLQFFKLVRELQPIRE